MPSLLVWLVATISIALSFITCRDTLTGFYRRTDNSPLVDSPRITQKLTNRNGTPTATHAGTHAANSWREEFKIELFTGREEGDKEEKGQHCIC